MTRYAQVKCDVTVMIPDDVPYDAIESFCEEQIGASDHVENIEILDETEIEDDEQPECPECGIKDLTEIDNPNLEEGTKYDNWHCNRCGHEFATEQ